MELFNFKNLVDLERALGDERSCRDQYEKLRWEDHVVCPHCESDHIYTLKPGKYNNQYKCGNKYCKKKFNCLTGTMFENTKKPLSIWFKAMYLMCSNSKGVSSYDLADKLGMTQCNSWHMTQKIRENLEELQPDELSGTVQADETFVGGLNKNRHRDKKVPNSQGRACIDKTPVLGLIEDETAVRIQRPHKLIPGQTVTEKVVLSPAKINTTVMKDTSKRSIQPIVNKIVQHGSTFVSDEWKGYRGLGRRYHHSLVDHRRKEYVNEHGLTTNRVEGAWKNLKARVRATHHHVSRKHLQKYCNEFSFRYNHRHITAPERFALALRHSNTRVRNIDLIPRK